MPVAQPFTFFGTQNTAYPASGGLFMGFPSVTNVDVSDYDHWIALGGTQKGQVPTPEQIELSLVNAGKAYWRAYTLSVEGAATLIGGDHNLSAAGPVTATSDEPALRCDVEQVGWVDEVRDDESGDPDIEGPYAVVAAPCCKFTALCACLMTGCLSAMA